MNNKNILVVGASSGIGLALVKQLQGKGANVFTASRTHSEALQATGLPFLQLDATADISALEGFLPDTLHGLVYAPGTINLKPITRLTEADFTNDFQVNVIGAVKVIQASLKKLKAAGSSSVVLYSTVAAAVGMPFHASVAASKAAVEGLARSLASELAASKIRFNVVAPSLTDTPLAGTLLSTPEKREASDKRHPLGRVGTPEELAAISAFLLSDESSWISGQTIGVDGGMSKLR